MTKIVILDPDLIVPNDYQSFEWLLFKLKVSKYNLK